ncbi:hypothetical protein AMECASPLE_035463 [Ameca splendens]|uniref:Uncharacterized protein n=1 Tax=Ameca splendens TaxID=208324 RepID=A0ABV1ADR7_9TELE
MVLIGLQARIRGFWACRAPGQGLQVAKDTRGLKQNSEILGVIQNSARLFVFVCECWGGSGGLDLAVGCLTDMSGFFYRLAPESLSNLHDLFKCDWRAANLENLSNCPGSP